MEKCDFHIHTKYCDGKDSPKKIVKTAIKQGLSAIGFSGHSYVPFDKCVMSLEDTERYINEVNNLKAAYSKKINIYLGTELDYYSDIDTSVYDYIIGSVHSIKVGNDFVSVDESPFIVMDAIDKYFNHDPYQFIDLYYKTVADVKSKTNCDIVGHFDLVSKFNEKFPFFDENDSRYIQSWKSALDKLGCKGTLFEINTGAISRGFKEDAYPSKPIREYIRDHGGKFILSSDSHSANTLCFGFSTFEKVSATEQLSLVDTISN